MASELRVNTLKDAAGNNSIATSFVAGGSAKSFINFNGTGTPAIRKSFNVSSLDDNGTGLFDVNFSSAMGDVNYTLTGGTGNSASANELFMFAFAGNNATPQAPTTSNYAVKIANPAGTAFADAPFTMATVHGDLA